MFKQLEEIINLEVGAEQNEHKKADLAHLAEKIVDRILIMMHAKTSLRDTKLQDAEKLLRQILNKTGSEEDDLLYAESIIDKLHLDKDLRGYIKADIDAELHDRTELVFANLREEKALAAEILDIMKSEYKLPKLRQFIHNLLEIIHDTEMQLHSVSRLLKDVNQ